VRRRFIRLGLAVDGLRVRGRGCGRSGLGFAPARAGFASAAAVLADFASPVFSVDGFSAAAAGSEPVAYVPL